MTGFVFKIKIRTRNRDVSSDVCVACRWSSLGWGRLCSTQVPVKKTLAYVNVKSFKCVNSSVGLMHFEKKDSCNVFSFPFFFFLLLLFFTQWIKVPFTGNKSQTPSANVRDRQTSRPCSPNVFYHWWLQFSMEADCLVIAINQNYELCYRSGVLNALLTVSLGIY